MAGEVDDIPAFAFFQDLLQYLARDTVLEHSNMDSEAALLGEIFEEAGELVTLAAEVEGGFAIGEAEDGEDSEAGADGKLMAMGIALDLKDQGDIVKGERLGTGVSKFEWKIQQRFGGGGEDDVDGGRGFLDQFRGEGAEEMLASPCAELVQDASFVFKTMIGRAISLEVGIEVEEREVFWRAVEADFMVTEESAGFRGKGPAPVLRLAKIDGIQGEPSHEIDSLSQKVHPGFVWKGKDVAQLKV